MRWSCSDSCRRPGQYGAEVELKYRQGRLGSETDAMLTNLAPLGSQEPRASPLEGAAACRASYLVHLGRDGSA